MRELNTQEMEQVAAAGIFADLAGNIGKAIGGIVDAGTALGGLKTNATTPATELARGIGYIIDLNPVGAITQMGSGIVGIVGFGIDAISQIFFKKRG